MARIGELIRTWRCRRLAARVVDFADGTLPASQAQRIERHVAACARCAEALAALQALPATLRAAGSERDDTFWEQQRQSILRTIRQTAEPEPRQPTRWAFDWRLALPVVTALAIAVAGYQSLWHPARPGDEMAWPAFDPDAAVVFAEMAEVLVGPADLIGVGPLVDGDVLGSAVESGWIDVQGLVMPLDLGDLSDQELEQLQSLVG